MAKQTPKNKKNKFLRMLQHRYRLAIRRADTFEKQFSITFTGLGFLVFNGIMILLLISGTILLIAFTQLREYIPGYGSLKTHSGLIELNKKVDSLEYEIGMKDQYIFNIRNIIEGKDEIDFVADTTYLAAALVEELPRSYEDSILRVEMERLIALQPGLIGGDQLNRPRISGAFFFPPVNGMITNYFSPGKGHFGIDMVAKTNEPVKATLEGTILFAKSTIETGNTIAIQHSNNLVSVYKHLDLILKKQGDLVKAGEVIGIIGNTGVLTTGTHLHFELWYQGLPVNPVDYIVF